MRRKKNIRRRLSVSYTDYNHVIHEANHLAAEMFTLKSHVDKLIKRMKFLQKKGPVFRDQDKTALDFLLDLREKLQEVKDDHLLVRGNHVRGSEGERGWVSVEE